MYVLLHNITKLLTLPVFSIGPLVRTPSKNEVKRKEGRWGTDESVIRLRTFLGVLTKFGNTDSFLFSVLFFCIHLESISNREECVTNIN